METTERTITLAERDFAAVWFLATIGKAMLKVQNAEAVAKLVHAARSMDAALSARADSVAKALRDAGHLDTLMYLVREDSQQKGSE